MIPTGEQICSTARLVYLGDTEVPGGQIYTDAILGPCVNTAFRVLYDNCIRTDERTPRRMGYYNLPAWTTSLTPADMGIANMGGPKMLWHRTVGQTWEATVAAFNVATKTTPASVDLTVTGHGLTTGAQVVTFNFPASVTQDINDMWHVEAVDANTIRLLGCSALDASGEGVGALGVVSTSPEDYSLDPNAAPVLEIQDNVGGASTTFSEWAWKDQRFRFPPATSARQIKVMYMISGDPPLNLSDSYGIDNSLDFLASYAAGLAAAQRGAKGVAEPIFMKAVGDPNGDPRDGDAGMLGQFLRPVVKIQQMVPIRIEPFRRKRNTGYGGLEW